MTPQDPFAARLRRGQRSSSRLQKFFNTQQVTRRRRIGSVLALMLACAGATAVMFN